VNGWRKLPHIDREVQRLYDYPQQFAEDVYGRIGASSGGAIKYEARDGSRTGACISCPGTTLRLIRRRRRFRKAGPVLRSSDRQIVAAHKAEPYDRRNCWRAGGRAFPCQLRNAKRMIALKKNLLTEVLGAGRDARIVGLPLDAAQVLRLMCPDLMIPENVPIRRACRHRSRKPDL